MPTNAKMAELKAAFEAAGFANVRTVLSSGNVVFSAAPAGEVALARKAEAAMQRKLGREFFTIVRSLDSLQALLAADPFGKLRPAPGAKCIVTFLQDKPRRTVALPAELHGARILARKGGEVFTAYLPTPKGPVFMALIEKTFGKEQTTRTWDTVTKVVRAATVV